MMNMRLLKKGQRPREDCPLKPFLIDGLQIESGPQSFDAADRRFDTALHRLSRWVGYLALSSAYLGVGYYLLS